MGAPGSRNRYFYADFLRVAGIIVVIAVHIAAAVVLQFNSVDRSWWWIANAVDSLGRWPVSVFIMLSGMLLLDAARTESLGSFFKKRMTRAVIPFLAWSFMYSLWHIKSDVYHGHFAYSVTGFLRDLATDHIHYHLWFFYVLIGLYLITPIIRVYVKNASSQSLKYFIALWLVATPLYGLASRFLHVDIAIELQLVTGFVGYFVMGYFLNTNRIARGWRIGLYILGALSVLVAMFGTYALTKQNDGVLDEFFPWSLSANVIALSLAVFVASQYARWPNWLISGTGSSSGVLVKLSGASLGVYLIHPMVLEVLGRLDIDATFVHPLVGIPVTLVAAVAISFVGVLLMQKIPLVRRLVP